MFSNNRNFQHSLACLSNPWTLVSIAILLLNDHIFKSAYPSWLTGKLSDFAGLFFFPFLLAIVFSLLLHRFNLKPTSIGKLSFGITITWFILIKTIPLFNSLTAQAAGFVVASPTRIVLDPTDLFALLALIPSWKIWERAKSLPKLKLAYGALLIASVAVLATSPLPWRVNTITNLEYYKDGIVYAADTKGWGDISYPVIQSMDGGQTWEAAPNIPSIAEKSPPIKYCGRINPDICYRLTKTNRLEESKDSGRTWIVAPSGSNLFVLDLILFEWNDKEYVIAAIGEDGILRRELPNGEWQTILAQNLINK